MKKKIDGEQKTPIVKRLSYVCLSALFISISISRVTGADEAVDADIESVVVSATRTEIDLSAAPSNISVLSSSQLQRTQADHIQQSLSQIPGVITQRGDGQESLPGIRSPVLTGAGACGSVLVLEEGIPVRGPAFCNINELFDTHFEQAGRVEVSRGPGTSFYGSNALTGAVNVLLPISGADYISLEAGDYGFARGKAAISYGAGETRGRAFITLARDGAFRDESGYNQQKISWRHQQELVNWDLSLGVTMTRLDQETAGFITGLDSYLDLDLARQNSNPEAFRETESFRAWAKFSRDLNESTRLQVTPFVRVTNMDFLLHFLPGTPLEKNEQTGFGWQASLNTKVSDDFSWTVGVDADFSDGELSQVQDEPTQGSAFLQATVPVGVHYDYQVNANQFAAFGYMNWSLNNRLSLIAGLRAERMEYDYDNLALDGRTRDDGTECGFGGCRYSRPQDSKNEFSDVSPKLELRYQLSDELRVFAIAASSFRAPQASELYRLQRDQQLADLDSVQAENLEIGLSYRGESVVASASVYRLDQSNVIIRDSDFFNVDGNRTQSTGLELSLNQQLSDSLEWRFSGSLANHEYDSDQFSGGININGNEVDTAPSTSANAALVWNASTKLSGEVELQHIGAYFLEPENLREYPGHEVVNLRTRYQFSDRLTATFRMLNLTDKRYAERADFTTFTDERYFPGLPRRAYVGLEYKFNK